MKRFLYILSLGAGLLFASCKDDSKDPMPDIENVPVIFPQFTSGLTFYDIDLLRAGTNPPVIEFTIDPGNQRDVELAAVEVYKSFRRLNGTVPDLTPRVLVGSYSSFPATIRLNSEEAIAGIIRNGAQITRALFFPRGTNPPDAFIFSFEYVLKDGRRIILTPLSADGKITGAQAAAPFSAVVEVRKP